MNYCIVVMTALTLIGLTLSGIGYLIGYRAGFKDATLEMTLVEEWGEFRRERREGFAQVAQEFAQEHGEVGVVVELHGIDLSVDEYIGGTEAPIYTGLRPFKPWWSVWNPYRTHKVA
ncbi:hypothetical protein BH789_gp107 [Gordonia phage GMA6]|uniref:Uncharacterized protein n=1 Tax=Gordonia phage GMA6 TaxID=1647285 RepID=A0A0K0NLC2_9CAUD|nr:hypothetical protein BH789_gp107 [Gordonia phage GMA6]AKL88388.1 hypothetical protein GMA6_107 [Gordonia phage GMA6]